MPVVELRQDRSLVNSNFDGYKLSLEPVPILRQALQSAPLKRIANAEQYSLLHAELFSMQNLLHADPWARCITYFVNYKLEIVCSNYDENVGRAAPLQPVYNFRGSSGGASNSAGHYNYTLRFISENLCVVCDGISTIYLLHTGDRLKLMEWKLLTSTEIKTAATTIDNTQQRGFILYDARLDTIQEKKQISLALGHVQRIENEQDCCQHYMKISWARWLQEAADVWNYELCETLDGRGSIYYCAFEPRGESLVVCSNRELLLQAQRDAAKEAEKAKAQAAAEAAAAARELPQLHDGTGTSDGNATTNGNSHANYTWMQHGDDIIIKFAVQATNIERSNYSIQSAENTLKVKYLDQILFDGTLSAEIDKELTTWTIENNHLQIILVKKLEEVHWTELLVDGSAPKENVDAAVIQDNMMLEHKPIVNLETPIEDCDFPMDIADGDEVLLQRFHLPAKDATHVVMLGSTPPLFSTTLRAGFPAAIATRQDVDASLWLQHYYPSKPQEWSLRHEGNLHAFGYVQASKQQRKFIDCAPDLSYAVISESYRHIFLYKSKYDTANGLRNRHGPQTSIGKQHMITLEEESGEVLGLCTACSVLIILTERELLHLQI